ncbi:probable histone-lysine N-methyltransferase lin-59 [Paramacrobiotus metropolitanus]|uniref:probable histone-lysine N-methyltransferase lin-59 n=1 Tax=Paramacrobiotus metropolitanus TaxID=2943436 RepID=UPI00244649BB|nr:probable histone-lysine N-methyltransferase lin-59 [Paramacrobiotus metropolitanus]
MSASSPAKESTAQKSKSKSSAPMKNGGLKGKHSRQTVAEVDPEVVNNAKDLKPRPPEAPVDVRAPAWPTSEDPLKMSPSKGKPPKSAEKLVNGGGLVNGNVGKAHNLFFPPAFAPFPSAAFPRGPSLLAGPSEPHRKRSTPAEDNEIQNKISAIIAAAPTLRPGKKKDSGTVLPPPPLVPPVLPPRVEEVSKNASPRKDTGKGKSGMPPIMPKESREAASPAKTGKGKRGTVPPPLLSDPMAQFVAGAPFNLAASTPFLLPGNALLQNLIMPSNILLNATGLPPNAMSPVLSPTTTPSLFLIPTKPEPPLPVKNFKSFKKQKKSEPGKPEKAQLRTPEPSGLPATSLVATSKSSSLEPDLDQLLSSVQSKISEFGTLSRHATLFPAGSSTLPVSPPLPPVSTASLPSFGTFTTKNSEAVGFGALTTPALGAVTFASLASVSGPLLPVSTLIDTGVRSPMVPLVEEESAISVEVCAPVDPKIVRRNVRLMRKKVALIDRALWEDVEGLTGQVEKMELSPEGARKGREVARREGQVSVLPFKKRLYKSVPSPKPNDANSRNVFQTGSKKATSNSVSTPSSSPPKNAAKTKETPPLATISTDTEKTALTGSGIAPKSVRKPRKTKASAAQSVPEENLLVPRDSPSTSRASTSALSLKVVLRKPRLDVPEDSPSHSPLSTVSVSPPASVLPSGRKRPAEGGSGGPGLKRRTSSVMIAELGEDRFNMTKNIYASVSLAKPKKEVKDLGVCQCSMPRIPGEKGCGETCMNRLLFIECDPVSCPTGERCSNQGIRNGEFVKDLEVFDTENKGRGVRTRSHIKAGTLVCEYRGEVISVEKFNTRMSKEYKESPHHYCLKLDGNTVIDAYQCGSLARYINHSCAPNCHVEKWTVDGQHRMIIIAFKDVAAGEEITYDYNFDNYSRQQKCYCGAKSCRGIIGSKKQKLNGLLMMKKATTADVVNGLDRAMSERSDVSSRSGTILTSPPSIGVISRPEKTVCIQRRLLLVRNTRNTIKTGTQRGRVYDSGDMDVRMPRPPWQKTLEYVKPGSRRSQKPPILPSAPYFLQTVKQAVESDAERNSLPLESPTSTDGFFVPQNEHFPASHFQPVHWEPSQEDVSMFTREYHEQVIRCACNGFLDEGHQIECEFCKCWQHTECMGLIAKNLNEFTYQCERCSPRPIPREIPQNLPHSSNPDNLDLYVSLMVPNIQDFQLRVGDCVYLTPNRRPPPSRDTVYNLRELDLLRIDKMFVDADGTKRAYGQPFLWPHETIHEATRSFYKNELIYAPAFAESVALEAVLGRFCVMESQLFVKGKPREFPLEHCYICEWKYHKTTNIFSRIMLKDRVPMNMNKFYFETYTERLSLKKNYRPHKVPVLKKKLKADAAKRKQEDDSRRISDLMKERCENIQKITTKLIQNSTHRSGITVKQGNRGRSKAD